jgi:hypothetical protein
MKQSLLNLSIMKNTIKLSLLATFIMLVCATVIACNKNAEEPEQTCKTCIARDKLEGAPVANERVCSDAKEDNFRNEYSDYMVSCE